MVKQLIMIKGLIASGKTTLAKKLLKSHDNIVRLSKDELRETLHKGLPWMGRNEYPVIKTYLKLLGVLVEENKSIILDDCNLNQHHTKYYRELADIVGYDLNVINVNTPVEECIFNDETRDDSVGRDCIINQAFRYGYIEQEKEYVLYDLEGTILDTENRILSSCYADGTMDYHSFYDDGYLEMDDPIHPVIAKVQEDFEQDKEVIIWSDRPEKCRDVTVKVLKKYDVPFSRLLLSEDGDCRPEMAVKRTMIRRYLDKNMCCKIVDNSITIMRMLVEERVMATKILAEDLKLAAA